MEVPGRTSGGADAAPADHGRERVARRRREWRSYRAARAQARSTGAAAPSPPRSASIPNSACGRCSRAHRAATQPPRRARVPGAPPGPRRRCRLAARHRRHPQAGPAVSARHRPRGGSPPARRRPRRRAAPQDRADPRAPHQRPSARPSSGISRRTAAWCFERDRLFSWSSDEKRRKLKAAFEASDAAYATYDRADKRLRRYERAVDAVERPRRAYHAPYSRSLEQVVAEADRRLAQERQPDNRRDHPMPRSDQPSPARVAETAPPRPPASPPASRQRRPPTKPPLRTERPRTGPAIDMPDGVLPDNPETPPARAGRPSSRTWSAVHARPVTRSRSLPSHTVGVCRQVARLGAQGALGLTGAFHQPVPAARRADPGRG